MYKTIDGGFNIRPEDRALINKQRAITKAINDQFIPVGAVYLSMSGKMPIKDDWAKMAYRDTNLQDWIDDPELEHHNVGFNLQMGWIDFDIDSPDPEFNRCILAAMQHLNIDTRFQFGRVSVGVPTHVLVQLGEEEANNYTQLTKFIPRDFKIDGKRYHVDVRSYQTNLSEANMLRVAKQTVMPGSVYSHKSKAGEYDMSVWWINGQPAENVRQVAATTPRKVNFNELVRAIAFGVFLYTVKDHWVEGSRQVTATKMTGWLARVVAESAAMNNHEVISSDVFCPVDDDSVAESLIHFVCDYCNDDEPHMRVRTYYDANNKLERNPDAKVPGWPTIEKMLGGDYCMALRTVFTPGSDVSLLTMMSDRYLFDESDNMYIDRQRHSVAPQFAYDNASLYIRHKSDIVRVGGKPREAFKVYESSDMRKRVNGRDMYPDYPAGSVFRVNQFSEMVNDEDESPGCYTVFNTWRGWPVTPAAVVDEALMNKCISMLDTLLGLLTQNNADQIMWIKKNYAWLFQNPGVKQQIAWVCIGGQGVGKSFFGNTFMRALLQHMWGSASPKVMEGVFSVEPFINKMFVFIDEAKFSGDQSVDEIKKIIRNVDIPGSEKFGSARNYRIYARVAFASNRHDVNVGQSNVVDRALFYTKAVDHHYKGMTELAFREWAETLKPWFEEFNTLLNNRDAREHYMRYFMDLPVTKAEVESIKHSSSTDEVVVEANMGWARRIAKYILEEGRIHEDLAIEYPFVQADLNKRVAELCKEMGYRPVQGQRVYQEFDEAGLIERYREGPKAMLRIKYKSATAIAHFEKATGLKLQPNYDFTEEDHGDNDCTTQNRKAWRGGKAVRF